MLRSRENSDLQPSTTPQDSMWISQIFHRYRLPEHLGCDSIDPVDGCTHRIQSRLLGFSSLKLGLDTFSNCAFYEIKEWEIAFSDHSKKTSCSSPDVSLSPETYGDSVTAAVAAAGFRPSPERTDIVGKFDTAPAALFEAMDTSLRAVAASGPGYTATEQPSCALPPKKRRHRRMVRYDVVFCFVGAVYPADSAYPCPDYDYYLFPSDAMVEAVNSAPPFESPEEDDLRSYPRSHSPYRSPQKTPGDQKADNWHGMNMILAGVSSELHLAIQQAVSGFEALYHKLTELTSPYGADELPKIRSHYPLFIRKAGNTHQNTQTRF
ncbi:hypothetical protein CLU79DRAFT_223723 [Phycomyces nitens]|nr:hypothetical protein CLU79DRAFT_223723 [Phycomyces nitens]